MSIILLQAGNIFFNSDRVHSAWLFKQRSPRYVATFRSIACDTLRYPPSSLLRLFRLFSDIKGVQYQAGIQMLRKVYKDKQRRPFNLEKEESSDVAQDGWQKTWLTGRHKNKDDSFPLEKEESRGARYEQCHSPHHALTLTRPLSMSSIVGGISGSFLDSLVVRLFTVIIQS